MIAVLVALAAASNSGAMMASTAAIEAALSKCLKSPSNGISVPTEAGHVPPGLIGGKMVRAQPIANVGGSAFSYEGTSPQIISCGIALYGPVDRTLRNDLIAIINGSGKGASNSISAYDLKKEFPDAQEAYWGIGLTGVAMLSRKPSASAPTIEIAYHSMLVR